MGMIIKPTSDNRSRKIFHVLTAINEALAISNEPRLLANTLTDMVTELLSVDCCWIQTLDFKSKHLTLAAQEGFTPEMVLEIDAMVLERGLGHEVAGVGKRVFVPDLSRDSTYGLSSFVAAGLRSLVAVPLMTYRVQGILGVASSSKKRFSRGITDLLGLIAGMIGMALDKAELYQRSLARGRDANAGSGVITAGSKLAGEPCVGLEPEAEVKDSTTYLSDSTVTFTPKENKLLQYLMNHDGQVLAYEELVAELWGDTQRDLRANLRAHIQHLKHKLMVNGHSSELIYEVPGSGYRLVHLAERESLGEQQLDAVDVNHRG